MKDLNYYKENATENYMTTPISVLRYITELEKNNRAKQLNLSGVVGKSEQLLAYTKFLRDELHLNISDTWVESYVKNRK
jgi:hypothetical protein